MSKIITSPSFFIGKTGKGLISFGSGQPDLPPPKRIFSMLPTYQDFKYGPIQGLEPLRVALARQYPKAKSNQFVITNGASEALDLIFRFLSTKGKYILLPKPYYYSYPPIAKHARLGIKYYTLKHGKIDLANFKKQLKGCIGVVINSPSNPTGSVQDVPVLKEIEKVTQKRNIYVISDEVYKDLIYGRPNYLIQGKHVITVNSFSKTYAMCGFRIGYMYSTDTNVIQYAIDMKTHTSMNTNILGQEMALEATKVPSNYHAKQTAVWEKRRDLIYDGLMKLGMKLDKPEGAFYVLPRCPNATRVVSDLYYKHNIITYDGLWFGAKNHIRFSYALDIDKIQDGLKRLKVYFKNKKIC